MSTSFAKGMLNPNINPYKTTYGSLLKMKDVERHLSMFVNNMSVADYERLAYGVKLFDCYPILITGKDDKEKALPPFLYPLPIETYNGVKCIAVDLRDYIRPKKLEDKLSKGGLENYEDLEGVVDSTSSLECILGIAKVMSAKLTNNDELINMIWRYNARVYGVLLVSLFNSSITKLSVLEEGDVYALAEVYYFVKTKGIEKLDATESVNMFEGETREFLVKSGLLNALKMDSVTLCNRTLAELVRAFVHPAKASIVLDSSLFNNIKGEWFGLKGSGIISMMMECDSLYIPIIYYALNDSNFKRSKIAMILSNAKLKNDIKSKITDTLTRFLKPTL